MWWSCRRDASGLMEEAQRLRRASESIETTKLRRTPSDRSLNELAYRLMLAQARLGQLVEDIEERQLRFHGRFGRNPNASWILYPLLMPSQETIRLVARASHNIDAAVADVRLHANLRMLPVAVRMLE